MTTAVRLLQQIDRLAHPDRVRVLAETARRLAGTDELRRLMDTLAERDAYGRRLALQLAVVAGHLAHIERSLDAPEAAGRGRAIVAAVRMGVAADVLLARVPDMPAAHRTGLYRSLRAHPSRELARGLLPLVRELFGDREAAALLPVQDSEDVATLLPELEHAVGSWSVLGRRHPSAVLSYVEQRLDGEQTVLWAETWSRVGPAVAAATPSDPGRVLDLLERSAAHARFPTSLEGRAGALARFDPPRFVRLLTDPRRRGQPPVRRTVLRAIADVADADLVLLGRTLEPSGQLPRLLHALPPSRRPGVHSGVMGDRDPGRRGMNHALAALDELPTRARHEQAATLLTLPHVADDPDQRLQVSARLDWASAHDVLLEATRRPEAADRASAWTLLTQTAGSTRDAAVWSRFLGSLDRFRNDQDVVRCAVLSGLAAAPPWLFGDDDAVVVGRLLREATEARDCSWATRSAVRALCDRMLREGAVNHKPALVRAALDGLQLLAAHGAAVDLHGMGRDLPRGAGADVLASLLPRIEADAARGEFDVALALARGLGRRGWDLPLLMSYVDRARAATSDGVVQEAISLWLAPPLTRDERVAAVLRADRSTITIAEVAHVVAWRRTDLLDDVLRRSMHGRFLTRGVRFVPGFHGGFDRWMPRQVTAYAQLLTKIATSTRLPAWERANAVRALTRSGADLALLRPLTADREVSVAEAALAGTARTADPTAALPELLALADTDRARVVVPAIARAIRFVVPSDVPETIAPLLEGPRITARKEAVRLLAEHRVPGAAQRLLETWDAPDQHRDVRRAVAAAARFHLDDPDAWGVLGRAADDPTTATALLGLAPSTTARSHRADYAALVARVAASPDHDTARSGLAALPAWLPWRPEAIEMLVDSVTDLAHTAVWRASVKALVTGCALGATSEPLVRAAVALADADDDSLDGPSRDRPARRRLTALVESTCAAARDADRRHLAVDVGGALAAARPDVAIRLLAAGLDHPGRAEVERVCDLAVRPALAVRARDEVGANLLRKADRLPRGHLEQLVQDLQPGAGLARGLVSVAIAAAAGSVDGWTPGLQSLVRGLRQHADPDVRAAASDVAMARE